MHEPFLLTLNAGSSSVKIGLFAATVDARGREIGRGALDLARHPFTLRLALGGEAEEIGLDVAPSAELHHVLGSALQALSHRIEMAELVGAGHRVVHGGMRFHGPVRIDATTLAEIESLTPLAPLHQPQSTRLIRALRHLRPALPQTASFDTAFHATQADLVRRFALPRRLYDEGIRRYGFHGLSYAWIAAEMRRREPALAAGRVVAAHLGSGASACALRDSKSVECSMGFSTLVGLPMGTRCGTLDAGVVLHLLDQCEMPVRDVEDLLYNRSGLLGVSGLSADTRTLEAASGSPAAREALDLFALRTAGEIARLATTLGGLDAVVFTAGIGEHDASLRAEICAHLSWLGIALDGDANERHAPRVDAAGSGIAVLVISTNEERVIADEAMALLDL